MLYCKLMLMKGEGNALLKCKIQPHIDVQAAYDLRGLPTGGTLLLGDGDDRFGTVVTAPRGALLLPPLVPETLWCAYLSPEGRTLAWGTADGKWRDYVAEGICAYGASPAPVEDEGDAPMAVAEEQAVEPLDLTDLGVVALATDEPQPQDVVAPPAASESPAPADQPASSSVALAQSTEDTTFIEPSLPVFAEDVERLTAMMDEYPPYAPLVARIEGSRFVEVRAEDGSAYLLGMLYDSTPLPTHLVYGVKGQRDRPFSPEAEWLSADEGDDNEGYWLVYVNL